MSKCKDCKYYHSDNEHMYMCNKRFYFHTDPENCCDAWEEKDDKMEERCKACAWYKQLYKNEIPFNYCVKHCLPAHQDGRCDDWMSHVEDVSQEVKYDDWTHNITDQDIKADKGKPQLTLVPLQIIYDIARTREYGLMKYGEKESWKKVSKERYRDALFRHVLAYLKDPEGVDEESGLPHLSHVAVNVAFLCELEKK